MAGEFWYRHYGASNTWVAHEGRQALWEDFTVPKLKAKLIEMGYDWAKFVHKPFTILFIK